MDICQWYLAWNRKHEVI